MLTDFDQPRDEGKVYGLTVWAKAEPVEQLDLFGGAA